MQLQACQICFPVAAAAVPEGQGHRESQLQDRLQEALQRIEDLEGHLGDKVEDSEEQHDNKENAHDVVTLRKEVQLSHLHSLRMPAMA